MNDATIAANAAPNSGDRQGNAFLQKITGSNAFKIFILLCVVANAVLLGYDAHHGPAHPHHKIVDQWNHYFLYLFTVELILEFFATGPKRYFKDGWNCFDFFIVAAGYLAFIPGVTAMRALRALRVFRLISNVPQIHHIIKTLAHALPGIGSALLMMSIVFFIGAVMATTLFRTEDGFHNLGESMISLMQLAFFDNWGDMVRSLNASHPGGWIFLVVFTLISAFAIINLFIGVIVDAVQQMPISGPKKEDDPAVLQAQLLAEVKALRAEIAALRTQNGAPQG